QLRPHHVFTHVQLRRELERAAVAERQARRRGRIDQASARLTFTVLHQRRRSRGRASGALTSGGAVTSAEKRGSPSRFPRPRVVRYGTPSCEVRACARTTSTSGKAFIAYGRSKASTARSLGTHQRPGHLAWAYRDHADRPLVQERVRSARYRR